MRFAVFLQVFDRDERQAPFFGLLGEFACAHHGAVVAHDFAAQAALLKAGEAAQIDGRFGVPIALEHAARFGEQGEHVPRAAEILRLGVGVDALHGRDRSLGSGNARGRVNVVDRYGEGRFVVVGVAGDHLRQGELGDVLVVHGHADEALGVGCHEVDVLGGGELRRANEVAFVFAFGVVGAHDESAGAQLIERVFDGGVFDHEGFLSVCRGGVVRFRRSRCLQGSRR